MNGVGYLKMCLGSRERREFRLVSLAGSDICRSFIPRSSKDFFFAFFVAFFLLVCCFLGSSDFLMRREFCWVGLMGTDLEVGVSAGLAEDFLDLKSEGEKQEK